ncbi:MAG: hypothetical protein JW969_00145 [Spirochaetales bacterium]|nr:hypothetical protein [Spirochaetales bacterium]
MQNIIDLKRIYESRLGLPLIERVDMSIFLKPYPLKNCLQTDCADICCSGGSTMDIATFNKLLPYRSDFPSIPWDDFNFEPDECSPGNTGCYTLFDNGICMFQNPGARGCSIHTYCLNNALDFRELKFFTCCMFPCEVNRLENIPHVLTAGYELRMDGFSLPCRDTGQSTVYATARETIGYYYGQELLDELDRLASITR